MRRRVGVVVVALALCAAPRLRSSLQVPAFSAVASIPGQSDLIEVDGKRLYIASEAAIRIFDLTDAVSPRSQGAFTFPERITMFAAFGDMVYAATDFGLRILEVSNPAAPVQRGSFALRGANQSLSLFNRNTVLVTNYSSGVNVIDVSHPDQPVRVSSYVGEGYARGIAASGAFAYLTDWPTGLYVLSLAKPDAPDVVKLVASPAAQAGIDDPRSFTTAVAVGSPRSSNPATIVSALDQGGSLHLFDVTKASAAVEVGVAQIVGTPRRVRIRGTQAFVASGMSGVQVVDLADTGRPKLLGQIMGSAPARDVALDDEAIFVATGKGGAIVLHESR